MMNEILENPRVIDVTLWKDDKIHLQLQLDINGHWEASFEGDSLDEVIAMATMHLSSLKIAESN